MKLTPYLVALAGLLLLVPAAAEAQQQQQQPGTRTQTQTRPRTTTNRRANAAPPRWGFAIGMRPGPNNTYGYPFVHTVVKGSNAERAGIAVDDTILSVNGRDARQPPLFPVREPGTRYVLRVRRGREEMELTYIYPTPPAASQQSSQPRAGGGTQSAARPRRD